jgi:RecB family endonuclease NucS
MPIHHAIWKVGSAPAPLAVTHLASEQALEDMIVRDPRILSSEWMLIGRQEITPFAGRIDLLATEIAEDRRAALAQFEEIEADLKE